MKDTICIIDNNGLCVINLFNFFDGFVLLNVKLCEIGDDVVGDLVGIGWNHLIKITLKSLN
jgi:hypothetical protein